MKDVVDLDPPYQRESDVWKPGARSTLIDSIINGLDVPKLYFEAATVRGVGPDGLAYQYAVIDGKQRLEAIIAFLADELSLADDFLYFEDEAVRAAGMKLSALRDQYPLLARRFLEYELPIVRVTSDSGDLIEEMFQRLNASTALNAAERRNALTGPHPGCGERAGRPSAARITFADPKRAIQVPGKSARSSSPSSTSSRPRGRSATRRPTRSTTSSSRRAETRHASQPPTWRQLSGTRRADA